MIAWAHGVLGTQMWLRAGQAMGSFITQKDPYRVSKQECFIGSGGTFNSNWFNKY